MFLKHKRSSNGSTKIIQGPALICKCVDRALGDDGWSFVRNELIKHARFTSKKVALREGQHAYMPEDVVGEAIYRFWCGRRNWHEFNVSKLKSEEVVRDSFLAWMKTVVDSIYSDLKRRSTLIKAMSCIESGRQEFIVR